MFSLDDPAINWSSLAESLGVTGYSVNTVEEFKSFIGWYSFERASLIEVVI